MNRVHFTNPDEGSFARNCVIALVLRLLRFPIGPKKFSNILGQSRAKAKPGCDIFTQESKWWWRILAMLIVSRKEESSDAEEEDPGSNEDESEKEEKEKEEKEMKKRKRILPMKAQQKTSHKAKNGGILLLSIWKEYIAGTVMYLRFTKETTNPLQEPCARQTLQEHHKGFPGNVRTEVDRRTKIRRNHQ